MKPRKSQDEKQLREEMVANLQQAGILDSVRENLKKQMADRAQNYKVQNEDESAQVVDTNIEIKEKDFYESQRIYGHLIAEYLRTCHLNYSYNIILSEMRIKTSSALTREEVCKAFGMNKLQYTQIRKDNGNISALEALLLNLQTKKDVIKIENETQTDNKETDAQKNLDLLDQEYIKKMGYHILANQSNIELQLHKFRRDCEEKYKKQMELELERIRENEIMEMKRSEQSQFEFKLMSHRQELDKLHNEKLNKLKDREREVLQTCKRRLDDLERVQFETSQKYIIEIEAMNKKELEFKNHSCLDHPDVKEEKARMKFLDQDLKRKMKEYEQATVMVTTRIEDDIRKKRKQFEKEQHYDASRQQVKEVRPFQAEDHFTSKQQLEHLKNFEIQRQYLTSENDHLKRDIKELEYMRTEQQKDVYELRDQVRKLKESIEANQDRLEYAVKQKEEAVEELTQLKEIASQREKSLDIKFNDQLLLHKQYTSDIENAYFKLMETEKSCNYKMDKQKSDFSQDLLVLRIENQQLQQINQKLDEEIISLRKELRAVNRKIFEFEEQKQEQDKNDKLEIALQEEFSPRELLDKRNILITGNDHKKKIDGFYKEMQELKERAKLEMQE